MTPEHEPDVTQSNLLFGRAGVRGQGSNRGTQLNLVRGGVTSGSQRRRQPPFDDGEIIHEQTPDHRQSGRPLVPR
jgi:hypothetical protein